MGYAGLEFVSDGDIHRTARCTAASNEHGTKCDGGCQYQEDHQVATQIGVAPFNASFHHTTPVKPWIPNLRPYVNATHSLDAGAAGRNERGSGSLPPPWLMSHARLHPMQATCVPRRDRRPHDRATAKCASSTSRFVTEAGERMTACQPSATLSLRVDFPAGQGQATSGSSAWLVDLLIVQVLPIPPRSDLAMKEPP